MHFTYSPSVICPSCEMESEWVEVEESTQYPEGTECPHCGTVIPTNQYQLLPKWRCSACNSDVIIIDCIDNGDGTYTCSNCSCEGTFVCEIKKFEPFKLNSVVLYLCPYCKTDIPASDLIPDGKGEIIFCPVCGKAAEI